MCDNSIAKIDASVIKLHGGPRERRTKYANFIAWQIAQRQVAHGDVPSEILKQEIVETGS